MLVHHGNVEWIVRLISDAEHDIRHLLHQQVSELSAAIATGGVKETGTVEGDGDVLSDSSQHSHHVSVVDYNAVAAWGNQLVATYKVKDNYSSIGCRIKYIQYK